MFGGGGGGGGGLLLVLVMKINKNNRSPLESFFLFILPYALTDILGRFAQRLFVQESKKGRIIVQRFKSIKVMEKIR